MANQQLVDYIKSQLAAGVTKPDLQKAVTAAGWSMQDSNEAFMVAEGKTPPPPAAPAAPVAAAVPVQPQPVVRPAMPVQPVQPIQPTQPTMQSQPVAQPMRATTMQMNVQATMPRRFTWVWATLIAVVLLVAAGAAAYMYLPPVQQIVQFYLGGAPTPVPVVDTTSTPSNATSTIPAPQTYANTQYGFTFAYPTDAQLHASSTKVGQDTQLASLIVGQSQIQVKILGAAGTKSCLTTQGTNAATTTINSVPFWSYETDSAATGQIGIDFTYQTLHNGACYSIVEHQDSAAAPGLTPGSAVAVKTTVLDPIVQSFRFTQ